MGIKIGNLCSHYGNQGSDSLKNAEINLPYDPSISFLAMYPKGCLLLDRHPHLFHICSMHVHVYIYMYMYKSFTGVTLHRE